MKLDDTVTVDHFTQKFTVIIRSLSSLSAENVKEQLEKKWEVVQIEKNDFRMISTRGD